MTTAMYAGQEKGTRCGNLMAHGDDVKSKICGLGLIFFLGGGNIFLQFQELVLTLHAKNQVSITLYMSIITIKNTKDIVHKLQKGQ